MLSFAARLAYTLAVLCVASPPLLAAVAAAAAGYYQVRRSAQGSEPSLIAVPSHHLLLIRAITYW